MGTVQKIIDTFIKQGEDKKLNLTKRCEEHSAWLQQELDSIRALIATNPRDESNKEFTESGHSHEVPSSSNNNKGIDEESSQRQKRKSPEASSTGIDEHFSPEHKRNSSSEFEKLALLAGLPADLNRLKKEQLLAKLEEKGNTTWTMKALKKDLIDALKDALIKDHNTFKNSTASVSSPSETAQQRVPLITTATTEATAIFHRSPQAIENSNSTGVGEIRTSSATAEPVSVRMELSSPQSSPPTGSGAKQPRKGASLMSELRSLVNVSDSSSVDVFLAVSEQEAPANKSSQGNTVYPQPAAETTTVDTDISSNEKGDENSSIAAEQAARQQRHRESQIRKSQLQSTVDPPEPSRLQQGPSQENPSTATTGAAQSFGSSHVSISSSSLTSAPCAEEEASPIWLEFPRLKPSLSSASAAAPVVLPPREVQMVYATVSPVKSEGIRTDVAVPKSTFSTDSSVSVSASQPTAMRSELASSYSSVSVSASQPTAMRTESAPSSIAPSTSGTAATAVVMKKPSNLMGGQVSFIEKPAAPVEKVPAKPIVPALEKARQLREAEESRLAEKLRVAKAAEEARLKKRTEASNTATNPAAVSPAANNIGAAGLPATVKPVTTTSSSTWDRLKGIATGVAGSSSSAAPSITATSMAKKPGLLSSVFPGKKPVTVLFSNLTASDSAPAAVVNNVSVGAKPSSAAPLLASAAGSSSKETVSSFPVLPAAPLPTPPSSVLLSSTASTAAVAAVSPAPVASLPPPPVPQQVLREVAVVEQDVDSDDNKASEISPTRVVDIDEEYTGDRDEYEIDEGSDDSGSGTDDEETEKAKSTKRVPEWARGQQLREALEKQYGLVGGHTMIDPDIIFPEVSSCSLEEIFGAPAGKNGQYSRRGSSAHWERDQLTMIEKRTYRSQMGYRPYATTPGASVNVAPGTGGVSGGAGRISPIQQHGQGGVSGLLLGMEMAKGKVKYGAI